ncbi:uroporphyrinogen-III C-methyltransferase [Isoalcanivorax beigongshangi]|uniref:Uroporphyrinogen-III C-methyltransferase n=1 Tax=Isoalcanivorax beigongshangi TaxID=3238810 RepID=A0ABV4AGG7_9GAMM
MSNPAPEQPVTAADDKAAQTAPPGTAPKRPPIPPRATPAKRRGSPWKKLGWLLLLLLIAAGAFFSWQWWELYQTQRHAGDGWKPELGRVEQQQQQQLGELSSQQQALERKLAQLSAQLQELDARPTPQVVQSQGNARDEQRRLLNEAMSLANLAEQQLLLSGDSAASRRLYNAADELLSGADVPGVTRLRAELAKDLAALGAADHLDAVTVVLRLQGLEQQVERLATTRPATLEQLEAAIAPPPDDASWWQRLVHHLPLQVRRHQDNAPVPMDDATRQLVRVMLESSLQEARLAVLRGSGPLYAGALQRAESLVNEWFDEQDPMVANFSDQLETLQGLSVARALPELGHGLRAMRAARDALRDGDRS